MTSIFVAVFSKLPKNIFRNSSKAEKTHRKLSKVAKTLAARQKKVRFSRQKVRFYVFSKTFVAQKRSSLHAANDRRHQNPQWKKVRFSCQKYIFKTVAARRQQTRSSLKNNHRSTLQVDRRRGRGSDFCTKTRQKKVRFLLQLKRSLSPFKTCQELQASSKLVFRLSKLDEAGS